MSEHQIDIIKKLLNRDPAQRLGSKGDIHEILSHPFFQDVDLDSIVSKKIEAPYKPEITEDFHEQINKQIHDLYGSILGSSVDLKSIDQVDKSEDLPDIKK